jgi:hypothetical protein
MPGSSSHLLSRSKSSLASAVRRRRCCSRSSRQERTLSPVRVAAHGQPEPRTDTTAGYRFPCEGAPHRADRGHWLLMAAASGPGARGWPLSARGAGLPVHELRAFAAGHGVHELGELLRECVVVDRWVDEDVGEVVAAGVLDEDGPVAVGLVRRGVGDLLVFDREVEEQIAVELAVEP